MGADLTGGGAGGGATDAVDGVAPPDAPAASEWRIDELARLAGTTVRNVRAYQDRGLLPPPRRQGRVGLYGDAHLARLRLIGELLGRGYSLGNIAEMVETWERGQDLGELLGLESALIGTWAVEAPAAADPAAVAALVREADPAVIAEAARLGVIEVEGDDVRVLQPRLLDAGLTLIQAGVEPQVVLAVLGEVAGAMDRVAEVLVTMVRDQFFAPFGATIPAAEVPRLAGLVRTLRPLARTVVDVELARAMEQRIRTEMGAQFARDARSGHGAHRRSAS